jgi:hypothetical protein
MNNQTTEELLLAGMERFTADVTAPSGLAIRAARHRRRRVATALAAVGAAATGGAVIAAVAVAGPAPVTGSQQAQTAAYVVRRTESALAAASSQGLVQSDRVTTSGQIRITYNIAAIGIQHSPGYNKAGTSSAAWVYGQQDKFATYASSGQLASVLGIATAHQQQTGTSVDYQNRTWWQYTRPTRPPFARPTGCRAAEDPTAPFGQSVDLAAELRTQLSCGDYTMAGTHLVDGVEALELKWVPSAEGARSQVTFWVDPATYLPVRSVITWQSPPIPGQAHWAGQVQIDYQWLAPTPANVAELHVTIPPGFTEVSVPTSG